MRAAIYCRVSTDEQARHGFSLEAQQDACMRYIKDFNHDLYRVYVDDGYSAKDMNRPALKEMLQDIQNKKMDLFIIWRLDRLTRKTKDGLNMVDDIFNKYSVSFVTIIEKHDLTTAQGKWMFTISLANAQNERELIGERVTFGQAKKASMGRRVSLGDIYGYDKINGKLEVNESEAKTVRDIYEWYVYKGWGYGKIASHLNHEQVPAKKTKWWSSTIKGMLQNVTYTGKNIWTPKTGDPVITQGEHTAILTDDLFSLAQTQLNRRNNLEMSRSSYHYPFSSIVKCGACGASYTASYTKKPEDKLAYCNYRCANKKPGLCKESDIAELKLSKLFFDYFRNLTIEAEPYIPEPTRDEMRNTEKEKAKLDREIKKLENRKNNLLDDLGDKVISREDYKRKVEEINLTLDKLKAELAQIVPAVIEVTRTSEEIAELMRNLETDWKYMSNEDRKFIIQMTFKRIVIKKEKEWSIIKVEPA